MNYANFAKAEAIVKEINLLNSYQEDFKRLVSVRISHDDGRIMEFPAHADSAHPYSGLAVSLVEAIKTDIANKLEELHSDLEQL